MPSTQLPDALFYYALSLMLGIALLTMCWWVAQRFISAVDKLTDEVGSLKESRVEHKERLDALEEKVFPINYKQKKS
jgi:hypothetical protein